MVLWTNTPHFIVISIAKYSFLNAATNERNKTIKKNGENYLIKGIFEYFSTRQNSNEDQF